LVKRFVAERIALGGPKYAEYEVELGRPLTEILAA
jgi:hypothetical protein